MICFFHIKLFSDHRNVHALTDCNLLVHSRLLFVLLWVTKFLLAAIYGLQHLLSIRGSEVLEHVSSKVGIEVVVQTIGQKSLQLPKLGLFAHHGQCYSNLQFNIG